jgi:hypothetical protein
MVMIVTNLGVGADCSAGRSADCGAYSRSATAADRATNRSARRAADDCAAQCVLRICAGGAGDECSKTGYGKKRLPHVILPGLITLNAHQRHAARIVPWTEIRRDHLPKTVRAPARIPPSA